MRKILLVVALIALIVVEICLCAPFLPARWDAAIGTVATRIHPRARDQWDITHPALDQELDQVLRQDPGLRFSLYTLIALLLAGNTALLIWVWRLLRRGRQESFGPPTGIHLSLLTFAFCL
jgi:hypothetical protein